jgi:hypothetical protein
MAQPPLPDKSVYKLTETTKLVIAKASLVDSDADAIVNAGA